MVRICCPVISALLVSLPGLTVADIYNQQPFYNQQPLYNNPQPFPANWLPTNPAYPQEVAQSFPQNDIQSMIQMPSQQLPGLPGQQLASQQMPYPQELAASTYSAQQNVAGMEATISNLQTQLASECTNEIQLVNVVATKQRELQRANASFAHILSLAETGAELEHELRKLLSNATAKNEDLQEELRKAKDEALQNKGEVAKWRDEAKEAEHQVKQSSFLQKRAENVIQDVQAAQAKVRQTEQIIHSLLPRLEPQLRAPATAAATRFLAPATESSYAVGGQVIKGGADQAAYGGV